MAASGRGSASDFLAAERTFLAWIRTGLALMGFGFVVARFGLFLREIASTTHVHPIESSGFSLCVGTALLLLGVSVNVAASVRYVRLIGSLDRGEQIGKPTKIGIAVAITLAAFGLVMAAYLLLLG